jgi:hypothetical protein
MREHIHHDADARTATLNTAFGTLPVISGNKRRGRYGLYFFFHKNDIVLYEDVRGLVPERTLKKYHSEAVQKCPDGRLPKYGNRNKISGLRQ